MTQKHSNANKPLTCPNCGGQNLTIYQKLIYGRYFSIEDGKMFRMTEPKCESHGDTWIDCNDCRQADEIEESEWIASKEEKNLIWLMREKSNQATDVSEFLKKEDKS